MNVKKTANKKGHNPVIQQKIEEKFQHNFKHLSHRIPFNP